MTDASVLILAVSDIKAFEKDELQRVEAIRSASFATQTLTLTATAKGFGSGIMIGFEPSKVVKYIISSLMAYS